MGIIHVTPNFRLPGRSLKFGGGSTDVVFVTSVAGIDSLDPWTALAWVSQNTLAGKSICVKGTAAGNNRRINIGTQASAGRLNLSSTIDRGTADLNYSSVGCMELNRWAFIGVNFDSSRAANDLVRFYCGFVNRPVNLVPTNTTTDGSGAFQADTGVNLPIGNNSASGSVFTGNIALFGLWNQSLLPSQIEALRTEIKPSGALVYILCGDNGVPGGATQWDLSTNGNHGTVTGATQESGPAQLAVQLVE